MNADKRLSRSAIFYVAVLLFFSIGAITTAGLSWYSTLLVPAWVPDQMLTAVIWLVLFLCTAISMSVFWGNVTGTNKAGLITWLYLGNAGGVLLWNYLFFGMHNVTASFMAAVLVGTTLLVLALLLWKESRSSALFLAPYLIWMVFALVLSYQIMVLN